MSMLVGGLWFAAGRSASSQSVTPQIIITQIKITRDDGQFITLYNDSDESVDLSTIQLMYFNSSDMSNVTSSKSINLSGKVAPHSYAVVDDGPIQACYQMTVDAVSLGLSSKSGFVQVSHPLGTTLPRIDILDDYVSWDKDVGTGNFLQRKAPDGSQTYSGISMPGSGSWVTVKQSDSSVPCAALSSNIASGGNLLGSSSSPIPYSVIASAQDISSIPADDAGLAAPQISEALPNPAPPQTDADNEFIELYNSNSKPFDLSDFILQVGTTTIHKYTFPAGTTIEPKAFSAFYSSDTGLSLSNSEGRVAFLDPGGNTLDKTDEYMGAKDGYAWVRADGLWQWTIKPTPGAANIILAPPPTGNSSKSTSGGRVKGASTSGGVSLVTPSAATPSATQVHPLVLAGIGSAALLYALYEYRHDMANHLYKFRRYRAARRAAGQLS